MRFYLTSWKNLLGVIFSLLSVGIFIVIVIILSPIAGSAPGLSSLVVPTSTLILSPESLCDQAFPLRLETRIPLEKRASIEADYQNCVQSRKTAIVAPQTPDFSVRPKPKATVSGGAAAVVPRTPAGAGAIIDNPGAAYLGPFYVIENSWEFEIQGKRYQVLAGARRGEGPPQPRNAMQGIVGVWVSLFNGEVVPEGGVYEAPTKKGPLKIISAQDKRLILKTDDGTIFYFDFPSRRFVASLTEVVPTATSVPTPPGRTYPGP